MSEHDADGATLCIHSVVTLTALRRKGLGQWMVRAYRASVAAASAAPRRVASWTARLPASTYMQMQALRAVPKPTREQRVEAWKCWCGTRCAWRR